jgi:4,5-dihydroxyphthalate decarboxylase
MHGTLVVKESVLEEHPWVAKSLFEAYAAAKAEWLAGLSSGKADDTATDKKYRRLIKIVGPDPLPYGISANRATIEGLESYAFKQRLTLRRMAIPDLFVDPQAI